ncbi:MAG: hypothetical protein K2H89_04660 [Oscillospiraceae bacterium]|nr:hypothetical protein [Oscillospiraceae bacterium]
MNKKQNSLPEIQMNEKTQNFFKTIYFVLKVILCGAAFFFAFQLYNIYMDLPSSCANSPEAYTSLVIFRFFKELPVIASAVISLVMMGKFIFSYNGEIINAKANRRFIRIAIISLAIASFLYNVLGIVEVNMLHETFNGLYGNAYYTIAIRDLCEPLTYALYLYVFGMICYGDDKMI